MKHTKTVTDQVGAAYSISDLQQWRSKLLVSVMDMVVVFAWLLGVPNAVIIAGKGQWLLMGGHVLILLMLIYLFAQRKTHPKKVSVALLVGMYLFGLANLLTATFLALIYLLVVPIAAALLLSGRAAAWSIALNAVTVFTCGYVMAFDLGPYAIEGMHVLSWLIVTGTFTLVSAAVSYGCTFLLSGMNEVLGQLDRNMQEARHMARHDALTGLGNRHFFTEQITQAIAQAPHRSSRFALILMDLDHFKHVNDSHGHHVGDVLIQRVAERLRNVVRDGDFAARLGGDEFVLLLSDVGRDADLQSMVARVFKSVCGEYAWGQYVLFVNVSMGVAVHPRDGTTASELLKNADAAMYHAKELGRNRHQFFHDGMNLRLLERLTLEDALRTALERQQLSLYYQPRISAVDGSCNSAEALLRWCHPQLGWVSPARFIPVAEENGMIIPIGAWVLRTASAQLQVWRKKYPNLQLSINVSAREFRDDALAARIREAKRGLPDRSLELEITESLIIDNVVGAQQVLKEVRHNGITVALDDFGTGLSSLAYLKSLPFDVIKIDKSFVKDVEFNAQNHAIVKTIIDLANNLKLRTVAEGVETEAQADILRSLGAHELQGYHLAYPMASDAFEVWLADTSQRNLFD